MPPFDREGALESAEKALRQGRIDAAIVEYVKVVEAQPRDWNSANALGDLYLRANQPDDVSALLQSGDLNKARSSLSAATAGTDPALWNTLAEIELADFNSEAGDRCIEAVAEAALAEGDYAAAAVSLHEFTIRVPTHLVALMRLVEICVDGDLEATMYEAQAQLTDAYLNVGLGLEARIISEDLVVHEPWNRANLDRCRRALVMLGEAGPDAIIAERPSGDSPFLASEKMDLNEGISFDTPPPVVAAPSPPVLRSLDQVFRGRRDELNRQSSEEAAAEQYRLTLTDHEMGMTEDAIKVLESATHSPRQGFDAASMLGRLYLESKDLAPAIEWLERAAEAPSPTAEAGRSLLYDLAKTPELVGESLRALAVFVESESGGYRDVSGHIDRLSEVQARG